MIKVVQIELNSVTMSLWKLRIVRHVQVVTIDIGESGTAIAVNK